MASWYLCNCKKWIEADKCAGNDADARVFVHEDALPASKSWFAFLSTSTTDPAGRNCWSIDPADPKVCLPKAGEGPPIYTVASGFPYTSCSECENDVQPDSPPGDAGGGAGGGGAGGGGGGGGGGGWPGEDTPKGKQATVCAGHEARAAAAGWDTDHLYMAGEPDDGVYRVGSICISVSGPVVEDPANAYWLWGGYPFETCSDCTDGAPATLCPDDATLPGAENAPAIWIRKPDIGTVDGFARGVWCYDAPNASTGVIPEDAIIYNPMEDVSCESCNRGVKFELCPGERTPDREYWAEGSDIDDLLADYPQLTVIYQRIEGYCHSLDLTATRTRIPLDAVRITPRCFFEDCAACMCTGEVEPVCDPTPDGIRVKLCSGQFGAGWHDTWLHEDAIPAPLTYFEHRGWCVYVDPADTVQAIPSDAQVLRHINNSYATCDECNEAQRPPGSPGGGADLPDRPPWDPPPFGGSRVFKLKGCTTGAMTNYWINENHACAILGQVPCDLRGMTIKASPAGGAKCYELVGPFNEDDVSGAETLAIVGGPYSDCCDCDETLPGCNSNYTLSDCDEIEADIITDTDLGSYVGQVIKIDTSDVCWQVSSGGSGAPQSVTVTESHATCEACDPTPNCGNCYFSDTSTIDVDWTTYTCDFFFFGNGCEEVLQAVVQRYVGTLSKVGDYVWSGMIDHGASIEFECPPPMPPTGSSTFSVAYDCMQNRWKYNPGDGWHWADEHETLVDNGCTGVSGITKECVDSYSASSIGGWTVDN